MVTMLFTLLYGHYIETGQTSNLFDGKMINHNPYSEDDNTTKHG